MPIPGQMDSLLILSDFWIYYFAWDGQANFLWYPFPLFLIGSLHFIVDFMHDEMPLLS